MKANQDKAEDLEDKARKLKQQIAAANDAVSSAAGAIPRDASSPNYDSKYNAFLGAVDAAADLDAALQQVIDDAKRLEAKHLREANAAADGIRNGPDDAVQAGERLLVRADARRRVAGRPASSPRPPPPRPPGSRSPVSARPPRPCSAPCPPAPPGWPRCRASASGRGLAQRAEQPLARADRDPRPHLHVGRGRRGQGPGPPGDRLDPARAGRRRAWSAAPRTASPPAACPSSPRTWPRPAGTRGQTGSLRDGLKLKAATDGTASVLKGDAKLAGEAYSNAVTPRCARIEASGELTCPRPTSASWRRLKLLANPRGDAAENAVVNAVRDELNERNKK